jgi:aryl-alcohol dehydrogenase-like predicted oxidoreductase
MRYKLLGRTGLCLGAMIFGDVRGSWGTSKEEAGGNFVDTANSYAKGESERILGGLISSDRERWVLSTKYTLNTRPGDPNGEGSHRKSLIRSLDESLKRLGTDYIELYWVPIWDAFTPAEEVVRALDGAVRAGKVLYVGISDTPAWIVCRAVTLADERNLERFAALQVPYSLVERTVERDLLPMARAPYLAVTTWAPLGGGLLTGRYGTDRARPEDTRLAGIGGRHEVNALSACNLAIAHVVNEVATERGATATQVAVAWVLAQRRHRGVVIPILGVRTGAQLRDNLGTLDIELTEEELGRWDATSRIEPGFTLDFGGAKLAYWETFKLIDDQRGLVDPLV